MILDDGYNFGAGFVMKMLEKIAELIQIERIQIGIQQMGGYNVKSLQGQSPMDISHPVFQSARILYQMKAPLMTIAINIEERDYNKWKQVLSKSNNKVSYLLLPKRHQFGNKGLCGSTGTVQIVYDLYPYILADEIQNRKINQSRFKQSELWFLLFALASASQEMRVFFDSKIGDVRPHNIFVNEDGEIKVSCLNSWPNQKTNFQKAHQHSDTFLAPQEINKLQLGGTDDLRSYQAQIFSIGMTILSAALFTDFSDIYDAQNFKFDYEKAEKYLFEWKNNNIYSQILTAVVCNLCSFLPQKRVNYKQFYLWINNYQDNIKNKQNFIIRNVPLKIQKEVPLIRGFHKSSRINSVFSNRTSHHTESFYKSPVTIQEGQIFQRFMSPSQFARQKSPECINGLKSPVIVSSGQKTPLYSTENDLGYQKIIIDESMHNQGIGSKSQSKVKETQAEIQSKRVSTINKEVKSEQVQVLSDHSQSFVSQKDLKSSKGSNFVYTRRIVNPTTNSLLGQESINEEQYHQGIIGKNLQSTKQKN